MQSMEIVLQTIALAITATTIGEFVKNAVRKRLRANEHTGAGDTRLPSTPATDVVRLARLKQD